MTAQQSLRKDDQVRSERLGVGRVILDQGLTVVVRFDHGIEECAREALTPIRTPLQAAAGETWQPPAEVIARLSAEAIVSVNDMWGVFSRSRIALLPHQLWVCRRVLERWPARWLVADDVGLGKTIEAGLMLWPLLSNGRIKRFLVLCPASLVDQWQYRLRTMFDIRMAVYLPDADTAKTDFWQTHDQVVASLETMREDHNGRHDRLFESDPWDLLIVDEAHRLNADEQAGPTLGYRLVERLVAENRVDSMVFFTGTPHRGKNYGFVSLLRLLRPDDFDPRGRLADQLPRLRDVMIRNNKHNVTDLAGNRLFHEPRVSSDTYQYSAAEAEFYALLTRFIVEGKAYASSLNVVQGRAVLLVLIAMQKLASSSVAAIRRALRARLDRIVRTRQRIERVEALHREAQRSAFAQQYRDLEDHGDLDRLSRLEEELLSLTAELHLLADEEPRLRELVVAAERIHDETKIQRVIETIDGRFDGQSVLLFTEYKATQSLLMSALIRRYGEGTVSFINGDDRAEGVLESSGRERVLHERRETAAEKFNAGAYRFLVSTEAGGEGIDLQEQCHCLIHVDLPWNPMRLHQRVGRLNRYGQRHQVEVVSFHNPDTVESLIWQKLDDKIQQIMVAFGQVMDEPEDLMQLILGMTSPSLIREVFAGAVTVPRESLSDWFDAKTAQFGGKDAVETVREIVGHSSRFDYQQLSAQLPPLDLPDLRPFFLAMLALRGRRPREDDGELSFRTPDAWTQDLGVLPSYDRLIFDRQAKAKDAAQRVLGVGQKVMDSALRDAKLLETFVAAVPDTVVPHPLLVFKVTDRVTDEGGLVRATILGVDYEATDRMDVLLDWQTLRRLNSVATGRGVRRTTESRRPSDPTTIRSAIEAAQAEVERRIPTFGLPYRVPMVEFLGVLWPAAGGRRDESDVPAELPAEEELTASA